MICCDWVILLSVAIFGDSRACPKKLRAKNTLFWSNFFVKWVFGLFCQKPKLLYIFVFYDCRWGERWRGWRMSGSSEGVGRRPPLLGHLLLSSEWHAGGSSCRIHCRHIRSVKGQSMMISLNLPPSPSPSHPRGTKSENALKYKINKMVYHILLLNPGIEFLKYQKAIVGLGEEE